ncbi:hypothetical protein Btru_000829, partial [Bulinus truncatus]
MPVFSIATNLKRDQIPENFIKEASSFIASELKKPELWKNVSPQILAAKQWNLTSTYFETPWQLLLTGWLTKHPNDLLAEGQVLNIFDVITPICVNIFFPPDEPNLE